MRLIVFFMLALCLAPHSANAGMWIWECDDNGENCKQVWSPCPESKANVIKDLTLYAKRPEANYFTLNPEQYNGPVSPISNLEMIQKLYVPKSGGNWPQRLLDITPNPGSGMLNLGTSDTGG